MDRTIALRLVKIAAKHGFDATINGDHVLVHIPGILVATGEHCMSDEPVRDTRELMLALGY